MNGFKMSDNLIEDKKQEIIDFLGKNFSIIVIAGRNDKYNARDIVSKKYLEKYTRYEKKPNWKENPEVWIRIHSIDDSRGIGWAIQIKCDCLKWESRNKKSKNLFAEKWGFPKDNNKIDYRLIHGNLLTFWVVDEEIVTFNPSQDYFIYFLKEAYTLYLSKNSKNETWNVDSNTPHKRKASDTIVSEQHPSLDMQTQLNDHFQTEIKDSFYQNEVQESSGWNESVIIDDSPVEKPFKSKKTSESYGRNVQKGKNAIIMANHLCEIDANHQDFTSKVTGKNYVEAHHLIPIEYQGEFNVSIDVEANIISLCVPCHKKLHHAVFEEKEGILKQLYSMRKDRIAKCDIDISDKDLFTYYKS